MENIFVYSDKPIRSGVLLRNLIKIRGRKCEKCGLTEWLEQPINLQVHHIDGDKCNNCLDNLQLLCLNCHSYTDNFGSKNIKKKQVTDEELLSAIKLKPSIRQALFSVGLSDGSVNYERAYRLINNSQISLQEKSHATLNFCQKCGKQISPNASYCHECWQEKDWQDRHGDCVKPTREELKHLIRTLPFTQIGKQYNVSDNAIRKWCDSYNLPRTKQAINAYSDQQWLIV